MGQQTALYQKHLESGAKIVDFAGWDMPINYGSQIEEHNQVRQHAGVFDVSHMTVIDLAGGEAEAYLRHLLANDVVRLDKPGRALYSAMLNEEGGVIDDLIVYRMQQGFRLVVNCATREKDLAWIAARAKDYQVDISERPEMAILAVHGPEAIELTCQILPQDQAKIVAALGNFHGIELPGEWFIARTGYTGEKGLELMFPDTMAPEVWDRLLSVGIKPVGLGARDTLRLEAGMNLYGHDMNESVSPLAANMEQTIAWQPESRNFIGREALEQHVGLCDQGILPELVGLVLESRGVLREGQAVETDKGTGIITSGSFSPTLKHSIALARIPRGSGSCTVDIRGTVTPVRKVNPNFVRFGKKIFE